MSEEMIGAYRIIRRIGAGGMGQVYLAVHHEIPNLRVILKVLTDERLVERFRQEADKLALLDGHPGICQIKHFFNHDGAFVIAMEYIDGVDVSHKVAELGKLPVRDAVTICHQTLTTLSFAHAQGISHRDIKPSNVMIDVKGRVKIIDFGIAKSQTDPNLTRAGTAAGTPAYMAPEQFTPTETTDYARADIYAVGTMLYYLTTGKLPFEADNEFLLRDLKMTQDPPNPRDIESSIPRNLVAIIQTAMARDPADRFASAAEMASQLERLGLPTGDLSQGITPAPSIAGPSDPEAATVATVKPQSPAGGASSASGRPGRPWKWLGLGGGGIITVVALIWWFTTGAPSDPTPVEPDPTPAVVQGQLSVAVDRAIDLEINGTAIGHQSAFSLVLDTGQQVLRLTDTLTGETTVDTILLGGGESLYREYTFSTTPNGQSTDRSDDAAVATPAETSEVITPDPPVPPPVERPETQDTAPVTTAPADLRIRTIPVGADVYLNGIKQDRATNARFRVDPGDYLVRVVLVTDSGPIERSRQATLPAGERTDLEFNFTEPSN